MFPESILRWNQPFIEAKSAPFELMSVLNGPKNPFDPAWEAYKKRKFTKAESMLISQGQEAHGAIKREPNDKANANTESSFHERALRVVKDSSFLLQLSGPK